MKNSPLKDYVWGISVLDNSVLVSMALNNPYWQSEFRKNISTSPYVEFKGFYKPTLISKLVNTITKQSEIKLQPDSSSFPINSQFVTFTLSNDSKEKIEFGFEYIIGFKDTDNQWYKLPNPDVWQEAVIGLIQVKNMSLRQSCFLDLIKTKPEHIGSIKRYT